MWRPSFGLTSVNSVLPHVSRFLRSNMFHLLLAMLQETTPAPAAAGSITDTYNATQVSV